LADTLLLIDLIYEHALNQGVLIHGLSLNQRGIFPKHNNSGGQIWNYVVQISGTLALS